MILYDMGGTMSTAPGDTNPNDASD